jgi:sugar phosphate isomerase/epimerase
MPWTDVKSFAQGVRVLDAAARKNSGLLIDPIHFDRGGSRVSEIGGVSPARLRYLQFCDAPAARPKDMKTILHQARAARLMPGDGGLDLKGIASAVPSDIPISLEIPMDELARTMPAVERTRQMLAKTRRVLEAL